MLQKDTNVPLHIQLADVLRQQILSGELGANQLIPSERALCETYAVSRITVRHSVGILNQEGLIATVQGKGTYVTPHRLEERLHSLSGFTDDMRSRGYQVSSNIIESYVVEANDETAMLLQIPRGSEVVILYRLRMADGLPIALQRSYLPHKHCMGILRFDLSVRSLYDVLTSEYQLKLANANMTIKAELADKEALEQLQLESPASVLIVGQTTYLDFGDVIEHTFSIYRGDRFTLLTGC